MEATMALESHSRRGGGDLTSGIRNANPFILSSCPSAPSDDCPPLVLSNSGSSPCAKKSPLLPMLYTLPLTFPLAITALDPVRTSEAWVMSILGLKRYSLSPTAPPFIINPSIKLTVYIRSFFIVTKNMKLDQMLTMIPDPAYRRRFRGGFVVGRH